ncbi:MAG: hypothetical protein LBT05_06925 [Planctomycetaceae bacterium]|jgi:hypothetical protein|nr:hypothetical protein [Planctomycetaceae bacterium]
MTEQKNLNGYEKNSRTFAAPADTKVEYDSVRENLRFSAQSAKFSDAYDDDVSVLPPRIIARMPDLTGFGGATIPSSISLFSAKQNRFLWNLQVFKKVSLKKLSAFGAICCVVSVLIWCLLTNHKEDAPTTADNSQTLEEMKIHFPAENQAATLQADSSSRKETRFPFIVQETFAPQKQEFSSVNTNAAQSTFMPNDFFSSQSIVPADVSPTPFSAAPQDTAYWNRVPENYTMSNMPNDRINNNAMNIPAANYQFAETNTPLANNNIDPYYAANPNNGNTTNYSGNGNYASQPNFSDAPVYNSYSYNMTQPVVQTTIQSTSFQEYHSTPPMQNNQNMTSYNNDMRYQPIDNQIQPQPQFQENRVAYNSAANASPSYPAYPQNNGVTPPNYNPNYPTGQADYSRQQYPGNYPPNAMPPAINPNEIAPNVDTTSNVPMIASSQSFRNQNVAPMNNRNNNGIVAGQNPAYGGNTFNNNNPVIVSQTPEYYK